jgi:hypothetical protein
VTTNDAPALLVALLAFIVSGLSFFIGKRALRTSVYGAATELVLEADRMFVEHPELRRYILETTPVPKLSPDRDRALAAAEFHLDVFEAVWDQRDEFSGQDRGAWREWIHEIVETSAAVREIYGEDPSWYPTLTDMLTWEPCSRPGSHPWICEQPGPNGAGATFRFRRMVRHRPILRWFAQIVDLGESPPGTAGLDISVAGGFNAHLVL